LHSDVTANYQLFSTWALFTSACRQKLINGWGANDEAVKHAYFKADFELRRSKRPDYYTIFGVPHVATEGEIKGAYDRNFDLVFDHFLTIFLTTTSFLTISHASVSPM